MNWKSGMRLLEKEVILNYIYIFDNKCFQILFLLQVFVQQKTSMLDLLILVVPFQLRTLYDSISEK